jgi:hypothetical protein
MKPTTAGERLYLLVRNELLDLNAKGPASWPSFGALLDDLTGGSDFGAYVKGAVSVFATRRILRYWQYEKPKISDESLYVRRIGGFVRQELFTAIGRETSEKLARAVVKAEQESGRAISPACRKSVLDGKHKHTCYLCGRELNSKAGASSPEFLTLEHLWPNSMGGDSIEDNLLPACSRCQIDTQDALSWEWVNVQNVMLPASPSSDALNSINGRVRYARHYLEVLREATLEACTLKQAYLRIGPIKSPLTFIDTGLPVTFFNLQTHAGTANGS